MTASPDKPVLGLLGGIGSGKSQVAALLAAQGGHVIVADELGHQALRQSEILQQIVQRWGTGLLDEKGQIVRRRLAALIFADPAERKALEALVFPWIGQAIRSAIEHAQAEPQARFIVLDAAVMVEAGWHHCCQKIVFVDTPRAVRYQRLRQQRGWTAEEIQARENAQLALTDKAAVANHILDNSGSLAQLAEQVERLLQLWELAPVPVADAVEPVARGAPLPREARAVEARGPHPTVS